MSNSSRLASLLGLASAAVVLAGGQPSTAAAADSAAGSAPMPWQLTPEERRLRGVLTEQDHADMMAQLGIKSLRPGKGGSGKPGAPNPANYDEAKANPYPDYPDPLIFPDGRKVAAPAMWWGERRPQIVKAFEGEVYGRIPAGVPAVTWRVARTLSTEIGGKPVLARQLVGHVDNRPIRRSRSISGWRLSRRPARAVPCPC